MNYKLVIQFPLTNASADDFDKFLMVENKLELTLRDKHKVDGHDIGSGKMNIFISTSDPDETFELARKALTDNDLKVITVAFRNIMDDNYSVIWPENYSGEFEIKQA